MLIYGATPEELGEATTKQEVEPIEDVLAVCEREIVRLLLLYAPQLLQPEVTVAHYILAQLEETPLRTPLYADLLHLCQEEMNEGRWPDVRHFIQHSRGDIRALVSDLATEKYELSPNWSTHQIYVPRELDQLQIACDNALLRLKKETVQRELDQLQQELRDATDPAAVDKILEALMLYKRLDNELASHLGTVIPRRA